jgi:hypothetical protein
MTIYSGNNYRKIYEAHHGPIPKDQDGRTYDIHHLDGNHSNNAIENLKAVTIQEHYEIHFSQGDYGGCLSMVARMKILPEEISRLSSLTQQKRVAAGTHHLLKRVDGTSITSDRVKNGTNPFLGGEIQRENAQKRIVDGSHNFLGPDTNC